MTIAYMLHKPTMTFGQSKPVYTLQSTLFHVHNTKGKRSLRLCMTHDHKIKVLCIWLKTRLKKSCAAAPMEKPHLAYALMLTTPLADESELVYVTNVKAALLRSRLCMRSSTLDRMLIHWGSFGASLSGYSR